MKHFTMLETSILYTDSLKILGFCLNIVLFFLFFLLFMDFLESDRKPVAACWISWQEANPQQINLFNLSY